MVVVVVICPARPLQPLDNQALSLPLPLPLPAGTAADRPLLDGSPRFLLLRGFIYPSFSFWLVLTRAPFALSPRLSKPTELLLRLAPQRLLPLALGAPHVVKKADLVLVQRPELVFDAVLLFKGSLLGG